MKCRICGELESIFKVTCGACSECLHKALDLLDPNGAAMTAIRRAIEEIEDDARSVK